MRRAALGAGAGRAGQAGAGRWRAARAGTQAGGCGARARQASGSGAGARRLQRRVGAGALGRAGARQGERGARQGERGARQGERARGWASGRAAGRTVRAGHGRQAARARSLCARAGPAGPGWGFVHSDLGFLARFDSVVSRVTK